MVTEAKYLSPIKQGFFAPTCDGTEKTFRLSKTKTDLIVGVIKTKKAPTEAGAYHREIVRNGYLTSRSFRVWTKSPA
jgi:hypothetical protein